MDGETVIAFPAKGRRKRTTPIKPISPFETDHQKAVTLAFDRETGLPVSASSLRTYADALAQYHISPESKFLNADYLDKGTTQRRHVRMASVLHIGKEAHDWERQAMIGLDADSEIAYGVSTASLSEKLRDFIGQFGETKAAKSLTISRAQLVSLTSESQFQGSVKLAASVAMRLPVARNQCAKFHREQTSELARVRMAVERDGLRETARQLGIDHSNLRRLLRS